MRFAVVNLDITIIFLSLTSDGNTDNPFCEQMTRHFSSVKRNDKTLHTAIARYFSSTFLIPIERVRARFQTKRKTM